VVERLEKRLQSGPMKVCDLRSFLGNPNQGGGPEDLWVAAGLQTFVQRHTHVFAYDEANQRLSLRASFGPRCSSSVDAGLTSALSGDPNATVVEARVIRRLTAALQGGPMTVCTLKSFLGNPNQGGGPEDLLVVQDMQSFVDRHAELLCFADAETKSVKLCNNISPHFSSLVKPGVANKETIDAAEARVIQRLTEILRDGPANIGLLKEILGDPRRGGGPEDLLVVADWGAFISRHTNIFSYYVPTKRLSLWAPADSTPPPSVPTRPNAMLVDQGTNKLPAETRVIQRLTRKLERGPIKVSALKSFLGNPNQGGGPEDLRVVADIPTFLRRHEDSFCYDAKTQSLRLRHLEASESIAMTEPPAADPTDNG